MIFPEEQHRSKERHSCRSNYCHSDSRGRRRDNTAAAAIHSPHRIGCHPDWRFRSSGTPCSPSRSEHHSSLDQYADGGEHRQTGRDCQRAAWSTSQCADDPALRHAVHLPSTVGHPLGQKLNSSSRTNVFCSSLNKGHQDHSLVPIGRLVAFDPRSGFSVLKKLKILRMNQAHRSERRVPQRFKHPQRESLSVTGLRV
jgi:hypothetical protein